MAKKGTETLAGARFGVLTDSPQHTYLHSRPDMSALRSSSSQSTLWTLLSSGSIDAVLVDNLLAFAFLLSKEGKEYDSLGPALSLDTVPGTHHIAIGKGNKTLRQALDKALQALRRNGQYIALSYRYFAFDID